MNIGFIIIGILGIVMLVFGLSNNQTIIGILGGALLMITIVFGFKNKNNDSSNKNEED
ncbi:hypothetical protein [Peptostreptococcus equinus]|uniref:Uncharacterized protein n=1 Tax=Peptostreptococcus equinus TaxID=3003601 RepID=A0ABY7JMJ1_9FIRM|nr:hypothetical protein [Peptostreptococcus sp. CBA3647]WAW14374.1 hypothetical protein O0R46_07130 [Peptostreptococcus sp. CBA3647]